MATIGRARAVAEIGPTRFGGFPAWLLWSLIHIAFLITFRGKLLAMLEWAGLYLFWSRGARLITGDRNPTPNRPTH
jgi:NADH dehydrogenase